MLVELGDRVALLEDPAGVQRVVGHDQAVLREPGQHGLVVADVSVLLGVHEDEVEVSLEGVDRGRGGAEVNRDLRRPRAAVDV